jgi:light-regulated signal transduction histidine kinase (bacteriophytochrome)
MEAAKKPEFESTRQELEELKENFQNFIYTVSHDLSGPIRTVAAFSRLLQENSEKELDERGQHYLSFMISGAEKAQAMLGGMLEYSRLFTRPMKLAQVDVRQVVNNCLVNLINEIDRTKADVKISDLPIVTADADQLYNVFYALINNALVFSRPEVQTEINISALKMPNGWKFMVEDNGIGIEPKFFDEIFKVYRRLHREDEYHGIGMGLAMAKKIVELHGGTIGVTSALGMKSNFWFTLPENIPQHN